MPKNRNKKPIPSNSSMVNNALMPKNNKIKKQAININSSVVNFDELRKLYADLPVGIFFLNHSGVFVSSNKMARKILGLSLKQLNRQRPVDPKYSTIYEDGRPFTPEKWPIVVSLKTGKKVENVVVGVFNLKKKGYTWVKISSFPLFKKNHKMPYMAFAVFEDVTKQTACKVNLMRLTSFPEENPHPVLRVTKDAVVVYANNSAKKVLKMIDLKIGDKMCLVCQDNIRKSFVTKKKQSYDMQYSKKIIDFTVVPVRGKKHLNMYGRDVTEKRTAYRKLKESENLLKTIMEINPNCIFIKDNKNRFVMANKVMTELYNTNEADIVGKTDHDFLGNPIKYKRDADRYAKRTVDVVNKGKEMVIEADPLTLTNGKTLYFNKVKMPINISGYEKCTLGVAADITGIKEAQEMLREGKEFLDGIINSLKEPFFVKDQEHRWVLLNDATCKMLGNKREDLIGKSDYDIFPKEQAEVFWKKDNYVFKHGFDVNEEKITSKGVIKTIITAKSLFREPKSGKKYICGVIYDISDRKKMEEELDKVKDYLAKIIDTIGDPVFVKNDKSFFVLVNRALCKMLGLDAKDLIGKTGAEHLPKEQMEHFFDVDKKVLMSGEENECEELLTGVNGKVLNIITKKARYVDSLGVKYLVGTITDITERNEKNRKIEEIQKTLSSILENVKVGIMTADIKTKNISFASNHMCELTGYTKEELLAMNVMSIHPKESLDNVIEQFEKQTRGEIIIAESLPVQKKSGEIMYCDISSTLQIINGKNVLLGIFSDVTQKKKSEKERSDLQKQLFASQKMEAVGTLAGGIAHDFNNLLTGILGYTKLAMAQVKRESCLYSDLEEVHLSAVRAADLTRQLLAFSRHHTIALGVYDINKIIYNILNMTKRLIGENISIKFEEQKNLWKINADKTMIEQILMNLAVNARDSMPNGGQIAIKTENVNLEEEKLIDVPQGRKGDFVCLSVKDTGTGIDENTKKHLFEPFFTTKDVGSGTGLGLSVVYGSVEQHKGWVNVFSEKGKGSEFKVFFPKMGREAPKTNNKSNKLQHKVESFEKILFVEDEEVVRHFGVRILEKSGYKVLEAASSAEAIEIFNKYSNISVLISDVVLPDTPGSELADILKKKKSNLKVVLCSGYSDNIINFKDLRAKNYRFLNKPYTVEDLLKAIKE